jgi:MFS family permease
MRPAPFSSVLRNGEFRAVWTAEFGSLVGDQLARVAVAVLVFERTASATAATVTYALSIVPSVLGGFLLSWTADRYRRRTVMVLADVVRAVLVAVMAVPGLPVPLIAVLLVAVVMLRAPHTAAQGAVLPQILGERYEQGLVLRQISSQVAQVGGFAAGGLVVALLAPSGALLIDVATFLVSAVLVRFGTAARARPAGPRRTGVGGAVAHVVTGARAIAGDPPRRTLVLMAMIVGCYVVPEAIAAPYAAQLGTGPTEVGLLMAAGPLGGRAAPAARRARAATGRRRPGSLGLRALRAARDQGTAPRTARGARRRPVAARARRAAGAARPRLLGPVRRVRHRVRAAGPGELRAPHPGRRPGAGTGGGVLGDDRDPGPRDRAGGGARRCGGAVGRGRRRRGRRARHVGGRGGGVAVLPRRGDARPRHRGSGEPPLIRC